MTTMEPWNIRNHDLNDSDALARLSTVIYTMAETLRVCSILLQPYMPDRAAEALNRLGVSPSRRTFKHAVRGADDEYGKSFLKIESRGSSGSLFPPLASEEFHEEDGEPLVEQRELRMPIEERMVQRREKRREARHAKAARRNWVNKKKGGEGAEAAGDM